MFSDLLRALADDRARTVTELADHLGADTGMVRLALEHCRRQGYLERLGAGADGAGCGACKRRTLCAACGMARPTADDDRPPAGPTWWRLTEKGLRAVRTARQASGRERMSASATG